MTNTNAIVNYVDQTLSILNQLQGLSAVGLTFAFCLAIGYGWRFISLKWFPNDAIPMVVMGSGSLFLMFIADAHPANMPARVWTVRNAMVGFIIGAGAWALHNYVIWRIEQYILKIFPGAGDTTFFNKPKPEEMKEQPKPNEEIQKPNNP